MRELKFRVWSNSENAYLHERDGYRYGIEAKVGCVPVVVKFDSVGEVESVLRDCVVEQYTGLKDKNGREIYEGDILKADNLILELIWANGETVSFYGQEYAYNLTGFLLKSKNSGALGYDEYFSIGQEFSFNNCGCTGVVSKFAEIIGNIHENPELLAPN